MTNVHTCAALKNNKNEHAKAPWVAHHPLDYFRSHPLSTPKDLKEEIYRLKGAPVTYWVAWDARKMMAEIINGNHEESYMLCRELRTQVLAGNPDSIVKNNGFKGEHLNNIAWGAAKAFKESDHKRIMDVMDKDFKKAKDWLEKEPVQSWARCYIDKTSK
ncbi:hypothetical protein FRX31_030085, partial [Thalictrum thalictroides]